MSATINFTFTGEIDSDTPPIIPSAPTSGDTLNFTFEGENTSSSVPGVPGVPGGSDDTVIEYISTLAGPVTFVLPTDHSAVTVKDDTGSAQANPITITAPDASLIDGAMSARINQNYGALTFRWNGSAWRIF